jgi:hypothetical protein
MRGITLIAKNCFKLAVALALAACVIRPDAAQAQARVNDSLAIENSSFSIPGKVVASSTDSEFRINPVNGSIQRTYGNSQLIGNPNSVALPTVTITCDRSILSQANCGRNTVLTVTISSTASGRAAFNSFEISPLSGSVTYGPMTRNGNQLSFTITFNSNSRPNVVSFRLGGSVLVSTTGATGNLSLPYTVTISRP